MSELEAIEQIMVICRDSRYSTCDMAAALKNIRKIAASTAKKRGGQNA